MPAPPALSTFIDFFWETRFENLWDAGVRSFSDAQFANLGYTYIINLGKSFSMQVDDVRQRINTDGFLPRYHAIESFHKEGDHLFGIKFRISPVILQKKVNFSEYKGYIYPLSYLLEPKVISAIKQSSHFEDRISFLTKHFHSLLRKHEDSFEPVNIVSNFIDKSFQENEFQPSLEKEASRHQISSRTLQRYFKRCTGITAKQALQVMRIRKAIAAINQEPDSFDHTRFGYYDRSHFYKHLKEFLTWNTFGDSQLHLRFLS